MLRSDDLVLTISMDGKSSDSVSLLSPRMVYLRSRSNPLQMAWSDGGIACRNTEERTWCPKEISRIALNRALQCIGSRATAVWKACLTVAPKLHLPPRSLCCRQDSSNPTQPVSKEIGISFGIQRRDALWLAQSIRNESREHRPSHGILQAKVTSTTEYLLRSMTFACRLLTCTFIRVCDHKLLHPLLTTNACPPCVQSIAVVLTRSLILNWNECICCAPAASVSLSTARTLLTCR